MPDDQLLPERLVEERKDSAYVLTAVLVVLMIASGWHLLWAVPLTVTLTTSSSVPKQVRWCGGGMTRRRVGSRSCIRRGASRRGRAAKGAGSFRLERSSSQVAGRGGTEARYQPSRAPTGSV